MTHRARLVTTGIWRRRAAPPADRNPKPAVSLERRTRSREKHDLRRRPGSRTGGVKGDDFGAAPESGSKGGSRCEAMICAAARFPLYTGRVILRQFPATMTTGPFRRTAAMRGRSAGRCTTRDTVNAESSPFVRRLVGSGTKRRPCSAGHTGCRRRDEPGPGFRARHPRSGTISPRVFAPAAPLPAGPAAERRGRRHAPVDAFQGPAAPREPPPGPPGAFAHASPLPPLHRKAVLFPAPRSASRSPLSPPLPGILRSPAGRAERPVPARCRAVTATRRGAAAKRPILTGQRRNSAEEDPLPHVRPAPGAVLSRRPLVRTSTVHAPTAIRPARPPRTGHRSSGNESGGIGSAPSGAPENHFPPYEDVQRGVIARLHPGPPDPPRGRPCAPGPPCASRR